MYCIYCFSKITRRLKSKEHVMPQLLGTFTPTSAILYDEVCENCNSKFGREIEDLFRKDSIEGRIAAQLGLGARSEQNVRGERLKIESSDQNVLLKIDRITGKSTVEERICIELKSGSRKFLEIDDKKLEEKLIDLLRRGIVSVTVSSYHDDKIHMAVKRLQSAGVVPPGSIDTYDVTPPYGRIFKQRLDGRHLRMPAKIAFNYFAFSLLGLTIGINPVFHASLDDLRNFILYGAGNCRFAVSKSEYSYEGAAATPRHLQHLLCWRHLQGRLIGEVSLFSMVKYTFDLGSVDSLAVDVPTGIGFCHLFDIHTGAIHRGRVAPSGACPDGWIDSSKLENWGWSFEIDPSN